VSGEKRWDWLKIINLLVVCYALLYFDSCMIAMMKIKSVLLSRTHFIRMKDRGILFLDIILWLFSSFFLYGGAWWH
jgi:hypothetical protein